MPWGLGVRSFEWVVPLQRIYGANVSLDFRWQDVTSYTWYTATAGTLRASSNVCLPLSSSNARVGQCVRASVRVRRHVTRRSRGTSPMGTADQTSTLGFVGWTCLDLFVWSFSGVTRWRCIIHDVYTYIYSKIIFKKLELRTNRNPCHVFPCFLYWLVDSSQTPQYYSRMEKDGFAFCRGLPPPPKETGGADEAGGQSNRATSFFILSWGSPFFKHLSSGLGKPWSRKALGSAAFDPWFH